MGINRRVVEWMDGRFYPGVKPRWDDQVFRDAILGRLRPEDIVLDVGAGAAIFPHTNYKGLAARVCGIDPDERVRDNPHLDEAKVAFADDIPYPDATFDLALSSNVLEHLEHPDVVFREIRRVLKPGGRFISKTPNLYHYMALTARLTPHRMHEFIINRIFTRTAEDTFPTLYRANTRRAVTRHALAAGLEIDSVEFIESRPEYLRFSFPTYLAGLAYERMVNAGIALAPLRIVMIVTLRRPEK